MFIIRNSRQVSLASCIATVFSVTLSLVLAGACIHLFKIDPSLWKTIFGLSLVIPLLVASLVTYIIFSQVMKLQLAKEQIEEMSRTDFLTRVYNRGYFLDSGRREISTAHRYKQSLSLMMIDLDDFKRINDTHGHIVGDIVIKECAGKIRSLIRDSDILARFGGDEFILLLPQTKLEDAEKLAGRIVLNVSSSPVRTDLTDIDITVSIGVASLTPELDNIDKFIDASDQALYRAKQAGRNTSNT